MNPYLNTPQSIEENLSLIAIQAAEELERLKKKIPTKFDSLVLLSSILQKSLSNKITSQNSNYRLDHAVVVNSAISVALGSNVDKSFSDLTSEALQMTSKLNSQSIKKEISEIDKLISFCVALSDSAALYNEELEGIKRHIA